MTKLLFTAILIPFLGLASCGNPEPSRPINTHEYFDIPGFINAQIATLKTQQAGLEKTVTLRSKKPETHNLSPVNWSQELQYFKETDLNKKALAGAYSVSETEIPDGRQTIYALKSGISAPIKKVTVTRNKANKIISLEALQEDNNVLVYTHELRELKLDNLQTLYNYQISGVEKVILSDSMPYQVSGTVRLK